MSSDTPMPHSNMSAASGGAGKGSAVGLVILGRCASPVNRLVPSIATAGRGAYDEYMPPITTLDPIHLRPSSLPLPSSDERAALGSKLVRAFSIGTIFDQATRIARTNEGTFRIETKGLERSAHGDGQLGETLERLSITTLDDDQTIDAGLPTDPSDVEACGDLFLRLFAIAESKGVWIGVDHRPYAERHLRYRVNLRRGGQAHADHLRAASLHDALVAGMSHLDRDEVHA